MNKSGKRLIVIVGPTAVGKTKIAISVSKSLGTEIISADSRQLFKEMNLGTAKPSVEELAEVKHHFIDSHSIHEPYNAAQYGEDALNLIEDLFLKYDNLVLCGGSGLYIKAVCEGFDEIPPISAEIRSELNKDYEKKGLQWLQEKTKELDPDFFTKVDQNNPIRMLRALEVKIGTGLSILSYQLNKKREHDFEIKKIGLEMDRDKLYQRIDTRMDEMIANGLFEEAQSLYPFKNINALQTVGYQEIFSYMDGAYDYAEAVRLLKRNSRRYAKRQMTWFKRDEEVKWFLPSELNKILMYIRDRLII